jgi:iron complex outermembrane receptor protein
MLAHAQDTIRIKEVQVQAVSKPQSGGIQSIDSLALADPTTKDLGASLQKYSHAFVKSYGIGSMAAVSLRGSGSSHTNLLWNGSRLNSNSHGTADLSLYPPFFTDNLEVFYGQNSNQFGSGGLGGAVSIGNQVNFSKPNQIELMQRFGSFGYRTSAAKVQLGDKKFRSVSRLIYSRADNDFSYRDMSERGFPEHEIDHADFEQRGLMQSIYYRPRADQRLDLHLWYMDTYRELPGMMAIRDLEEVQEDENLRAQFIFHQYFKGGKLIWNSSLVNDRLFYDNRELTEASESDNLSVRNFLQAEYQTKSWSFNARADLDWESATQAHLSEGARERIRKAFYLQSERTIADKWELTAAMRGEWIAREFFFLPELKVAMHSGERGVIWLLAGENMKYPSLNDLYWASGGNPELRAEESRSLELGYSQEIKLNEKLSFEFKQTLYYSRIDDYIQWVPTNRGYWRAENVKEVESSGLETSLGLNYRAKRFSQQFALNYNYNRAINLRKNHPEDASVGKQLIYQPRHQYNLNSRTIVGKYYFDANLQFVGRRYLQSDNLDYLPYFSLIDLSLGRNLAFGNDQLQLSVSVRNLLDEEYQAIQWRPMPGRNYMLTLNYKLK